MDLPVGIVTLWEGVRWSRVCVFCFSMFPTEAFITVHCHVHFRWVTPDVPPAEHPVEKRRGEDVVIRRIFIRYCLLPLSVLYRTGCGEMDLR